MSEERPLVDPIIFEAPSDEFRGMKALDNALKADGVDPNSPFVNLDENGGVNVGSLYVKGSKVESVKDRKEAIIRYQENKLAILALNHIFKLIDEGKSIVEILDSIKTSIGYMSGLPTMLAKKGVEQPQEVARRSAEFYEGLKVVVESMITQNGKDQSTEVLKQTLLTISDLFSSQEILFKDTLSLIDSDIKYLDMIDEQITKWLNMPQ